MKGSLHVSYKSGLSETFEGDGWVVKVSGQSRDILFKKNTIKDILFKKKPSVKKCQAE